jgi:hypothetical protein
LFGITHDFVEDVGSFCHVLLRTFTLEGSVSDAADAFELDGFDELFIVAECGPSVFGEAVLFADVFFLE